MAWTSVLTQTQTDWTDVPNAQIPSSLIGTAGEPIGLLLALTQSTTTIITVDPWTDVNIQSQGQWTSVLTSTNN